jgi:sugar lactone lactonase YvrE
MHTTLSALLCYCLALLGLSAAAPTTPSPATHNVTTLTSTSLVEFPKGTWLENLVIRQADGNALVTVLSAPEVLLISTSSEFAPITVAAFPSALGCLGIVELGHNIFYVVAGNWSAATGLSTPGSYSIWEIDMRHPSPEHAKTRKVAELPNSGFLNGMTVLDPVAGTLLVADSLYSAIWSVNVYTGTVEVVVNDTTLSPLPDASPPLGINGLHLLGSELYYDNTNRATFNKIPIDLHTGHPTGPAETIVQSTTAEIFPDDFTVDFLGNAWMTADIWGQLDLLPRATLSTSNRGNVKVDIVAGSKEAKSNTGWTAAQLGTKQEDLKRGSLYVTTNGGPINYVYSNWTAGGMLLRLDTVGLGLY